MARSWGIRVPLGVVCYAPREWDIWSHHLAVSGTARLNEPYHLVSWSLWDLRATIDERGLGLNCLWCTHRGSHLDVFCISRIFHGIDCSRRDP